MDSRLSSHPFGLTAAESRSISGGVEYKKLMKLIKAKLVSCKPYEAVGRRSLLDGTRGPAALGLTFVTHLKRLLP